jgi:hypothetical protein
MLLRIVSSFYEERRTGRKDEGKGGKKEGKKLLAGI